jgi:hypothetical protein
MNFDRELVFEQGNMLLIEDRLEGVVADDESAPSLHRG